MLSGAVPVVFSYSGRIALPLDQVIDWRKAIFQFPFGRLPELPYTLSSITPGFIFYNLFSKKLFYEIIMGILLQFIFAVRNLGPKNLVLEK